MGSSRYTAWVRGRRRSVELRKALRRVAVVALLGPLLGACGTVVDRLTSDEQAASAALSDGDPVEITVGDLDGRSVSGTIFAYVETDGWIRSVRFILNGSLVADVRRAPFGIAIDTTTLTDGDHVLVAEPTMPNGRVRDRAVASFVVNNAPTTEEPVPAPVEPDGSLLTWAPPELTSPTTILVGVTGAVGTLDKARDYVLVMPGTPRTEGLVINGGRNVVVIGGEIAIPHQGENPTINARRALYVAHSTGVVHVEGLLLHGDDISEGVQTNAPLATVQLQNLAVLNVHARDQVSFTDNHPDVIQTWGGIGELRVDRLTGETDYQGLFFKSDFNGPHGPVHLRNVNIRSMDTTRYQFWMADTGGGYPTVTLEEVWVETAPGRSFGKTVWPDVDSATHPPTISDGAASWPTLPVTGVVRSGVPAGGDFVSAASVGIGYVSPGYRGEP
jgi:hypothetical protein